MIYYKKIEKTMPRNYIIYRIAAAGLAVRLAFMRLVVPIDFASGSYQSWRR